MTWVLLLTIIIIPFDVTENMIPFNQPDNLLQNRAVWVSQMDVFSIISDVWHFAHPVPVWNFLSVPLQHIPNLASISTLINFLCFRYSLYTSIIHLFLWFLLGSSMWYLVYPTLLCTFWGQDLCLYFAFQLRQYWPHIIFPDNLEWISSCVLNLFWCGTIFLRKLKF